MNIPTPPERSPNSSKKSGLPRPNLATWAALATIGALVVAVATFVLQFFGPSWGLGANNLSPQSSASSSIVAESRESPVPGPSASTSPAGPCLDDSWNPVSCDRAHSAELISAEGPCTQDALISYAGGAAPLDTLRVDLQPKTVEGVGCLVALPDGLGVRIKDGLSGRDHAVLRRCSDRFSQRDVSCDQPHTAEIVHSNPDPGLAETDCRAQAEEYTDNAFSRYGTKLEVLSRTSADDTTCVVQVKGSNVLTGSLRNLASRALPISPS